MKKKIRDPKRQQQLARRRRVTRSVAGSSRTRLTVFRSARHIYAQLIDDANGKTLAQANSRESGVKAEEGSAGGVSAAKAVGKAIAERAREQGVKSVVFDRGGSIYHGKVRAVAEGAREAGLEF